MHGRTSPVRQMSVLAILAIGACLSVQTVLAEEFDWRNVNGQNWLSPVQNQGSWGVCWAYAACGALESKYMITRNDPNYQPNVSEQQLVWEGNPDLGNGTDGGLASDSLNYFKNHGVVLESEIPKKGNGTDNYVSGDPWLTSGWENRRFLSTSVETHLAQSTNLAYIKSCLKAYGPLTLRCEVDNDWYDPAPSANRGNHAVVIVGYHDNLPGENAPGGGYSIIKNSWGDGWNGNGYGEISYAARPTYEDYSWIPFWPQYNVNVCGNTGQVYFTGAMATVTWNGGASGAWSSGGSTWSGNDMYGNALPTYAWENKETTANFNTPGGTVTLSGTVIAHGLAINSGATGYTFSGGPLTLTSGGLSLHETTTINSDISIGAPQTWTLDTGKYLTIGNLHTIISPLTINANSPMYIHGSIDGGGAANTAGMAPGTITLNGNGSLNLINSALVAANIVNNSSGGFYISVGNDYPTSWTGSISGGGGPIRKTNAGRLIFYANNTYSGATDIQGGVLEADNGAGLSGNSLLMLNGGVLQSHSTTTFARNLGTGAGQVEWMADDGYGLGGGGFSAGINPLSVTISNYATVDWGNSVGNSIMGTLKFGSTSSQNAVTFTNGINLNGNDRTIYVEDNPNSGSDIAVIAGNIVDITGPYWACVTKTGPGTLKLTGTNNYGNGTQSGLTIIQQGALQADRGVGLPWSSNLMLRGGVLQSNSAITFSDVFWNDTPNANGVNWDNGGFSAGGGKMTVNLYGDGRAINWGADPEASIVGTMILSSNSAQYETEIQNGLNLNGASRTIQVDDNPFTVGDFATISGVIADSVGSNGIIKTGAGTLRLTAANTFAGNISVNAGTLVADGSTGCLGPSSTSRTITVNSGATLNFANSDVFGGHTNTAIPTVDVEGGFVAKTNGGHQEFNNLILRGGTLYALADAGTPGSDGWGSFNFNGSVTSYGGSHITYTNLVTTDFNASITLQSGDVANPNTTFDVVDGVLLNNVPIYDGIDGHITGGHWNTHATSLTKTDAGELWLISDNHYSGATIINGGVIETDRLAANGSVSGLGTGSSLVINGGTFKYVGGANIVFNRLIALGAGGGTIDQSGTSYLVAKGVISGSGSLTKIGNARLMLQANNTYTGQTNVNVGNLQIQDANALGTTDGKTVVASGAFLSAGGAMSGTIYEPIDLNGSPDGSSGAVAGHR